LDEKDKGSGKSEEPAERAEETPDTKKLKWDNRLRQTGVKFPAKLVSKELKGPSQPGADGDEPPGGEGKAEPAKSPELAPDDGGPGGQPSKALKPEGWESSSPPPEPSAEVERPAPKLARFSDMLPVIRRRVVKRIPFIYALAGGLVAVIFFSVVFWKFGFGAGIESSLEEETKERVTVSKEFHAELDQALADLRAGNTDKAVRKLQELEEAKTGVASLAYLVAVAAVQNGDIPLAEAKTAESISKRERISDSLALQAVLETQKGGDPSIKKFGDTRVRSEVLLRQSMLADEANPFPMIELATLLRYQKRDEEALALLRGARSRLNPVDSHSVVDVTIGLTALHDTPDDQLPRIAEPGKDIVSAFSAAYVAMRNGDFDRAAEIVKTAREMTSPDLFDYLINDPAIRRYAGDPKLREFFR